MSSSKKKPEGNIVVRAVDHYESPHRHTGGLAELRSGEKPKKKKSKIIPLLLLGTALSAGAIAFLLFSKNKSEKLVNSVRQEEQAIAQAQVESEQYFSVSIEATPGTSIIEIDDLVVGTGNYFAKFPINGTAHTLNIRADGFVSYKGTFTDTSPPATIGLMKESAADVPAINLTAAEDKTGDAQKNSPSTTPESNSNKKPVKSNAATKNKPNNQKKINLGANNRRKKAPKTASFKEATEEQGRTAATEPVPKPAPKTEPIPVPKIEPIPKTEPRPAPKTEPKPKQRKKKIKSGPTSDNKNPWG